VGEDRLQEQPPEEGPPVSILSLYHLAGRIYGISLDDNLLYIIDEETLIDMLRRRKR
jgi:hypothetical protein